MKKYIFIILISCSLIACKKDKEYEYPVIHTGEVTDITSEGAIFHGKISSSGNSGIIDYGFVWNTNGLPTVENDYIKSLGNKNLSGNFKAEINSSIKQGRRYYMRCYIRNELATIYGREVSFISLGSKAPVITSFSPEIATWGDTITILGENFSYKKDENGILFSSNKYSKTISATDKEIKVLVPESLDSASSKITVIVQGNKIETSSDFKLTKPEIDSFTPNEGIYQTEVDISGNYFHEDFTIVKFDTTKAEIKNITTNQITVRVPTGLPPGELDLAVTVAGQKVVAQTKFKSLTPTITSFSPGSGTFDDIITINGTNFSTVSKETTVKFGEHEAEIIEVSNDELIVKVPNSIETETMKINVIIMEQVAISEQNFTFLKPIITSFSPKTATFGDEIIISGNYFSNNVDEMNISFDNENAVILSSSKQEIKVKVPESLKRAKTLIGISYFNQSCSSNEEFTLLGPIIESFSPQTGTFGDEIIISGENFNPDIYNNIVRFGDTIATISAATKNELKVKVPNNYYSKNGKSTISIEIGEVNDNSNQEFELNLHSINNIAPLHASRGDIITLHGQNFNPVAELNNIMIGSENTEVISSTSSTIEFKFIDILEPTSYSINLEIAGRNIQSSESLIVHEPWLKLPNCGGGARRYAFSFSINGKGYIGAGSKYPGTGSKYDLWEYDPISKAWSEKKHLSAEMVSYFPVSFTTESFAYVLYGDNKLWRYDQTRDIWDRMSDFPGEQKIYRSSFSIGSKGYIGTGKDGKSIRTSEFWEYDETTNAWTRKADYGGGAIASGVGFSINGKGYIGLGEYKNSEIWEYNPEDDTWTKKISLDGIIEDIFRMRVLSVATTCNGKAYIMTGSSHNTGSAWSGYNDIYLYDPILNTCKRTVNLPADGRMNAACFTIEDKVYLGTGQLFYGYSRSTDDFWEFDPSKLKPE